MADFFFTIGNLFYSSRQYQTSDLAKARKYLRRKAKTHALSSVRFERIGKTYFCWVTIHPNPEEAQ